MIGQMYTPLCVCQRVDADCYDWHSSTMSNRPIYLVANWKMNGTAARARDWAFAVNEALSTHPTLTGVLCPPALYISDAKLGLPHNAGLKLGAQNCHEASNGAFTGEISAPMLADMGCTYVIVGHSECRAMGETDAQVEAKARAAIEAGLTPIICIGESREAYEKGETLAVLSAQLQGVAKLPGAAYLVAYEPIWAIGSSKTPELDEIQTVHRHIKSVLGSARGVLYGGSVKAGNIGKIVSLPDVSGALIGGASLEIESMCAMISETGALRGK